MPNPYVLERLSGLLAGLNATYAATASSAAAAKGAGRANFIDSFLKQVIPPGWRISTNGEITDAGGTKTGELDIIIENGFFPSLPVIGIESSRLYFAEGVAAVIEVKSNLQGQWSEAVSTGAKLEALDRHIKGGIMGGSSGPFVIQLPMTINNANLPKMSPMPKDIIKKKVPYFVVGYKGWSNPETIVAKLDEAGGSISGILQLDIGYFAGSAAFDSVRATGALSLLGFLNSINEASSYIKSATADLLSYGR
ncbi:DUF6602 domain-containing protein [Halopseudomonas sp.]|uniref:DUF6602 domain-containing protein n=1 Tax=Halopseudomonas sp. TaxID=2901191 RepID=UPI003001FC6E